jgi:ABC-type amino acid transport substrate-binding protein
MESWVGIFVLILSLGILNQAHSADVIVGIGEQNLRVLAVEKGRFSGSLAKYYQCALDKSGFSFEYRVLPHQRVLQQLKQGDIDLGLPLVKVESRGEFAVFAHSIVDTPFALYTRRDLNVSGDLSGYTFVVVRHTASVDLAVKHEAQIIEVESWTQALALAKLGRYDGAVVPEEAIVGLDPEVFEGLTKYSFGSIPASIYVSRQIGNTEALVKRLNSAIDACSL